MGFIGTLLKISFSVGHATSLEGRAIRQTSFHPASDRARSRDVLLAEKNWQFAGSLPGVQSNFSSRGIISLTSACSPQKNVPFAFRQAILFRVSFGEGGQCIAIKASGARRPFAALALRDMLFFSPWTRRSIERR
jgi:hypothetical protein